ncbi:MULTISPECIES: hypothetical protein [unclassified Streptomyces]|uniref:hypothetical protein n=1 Tax=unclassified Streptomyces TaxID=2593676 RepID=UPI0004C72123|nr:hypothetical protein [Streptomyces sp. NRRL F-2747]
MTRAGRHTLKLHRDIWVLGAVQAKRDGLAATRAVQHLLAGFASGTITIGPITGATIGTYRANVEIPDSVWNRALERAGLARAQGSGPVPAAMADTALAPDISTLCEVLIQGYADGRITLIAPSGTVRVESQRKAAA